MYLYKFFAIFFLLIIGCSKPWNNPYQSGNENFTIHYSSFAERPKHLDPVSSYSENEARFISQIYEPLVQYHYLDRPYRLEPLTATTLPKPISLQDESINYSIYRIKIKPGISYQPHPCFAKDSQGKFLYHDLTDDQISQIKTFSFFTLTGARELTAYDYAFQIKRLAHPKKHSPISGLMSKYIVGFKELKENLAVSNQKGHEIDLRKFNIAGVKVLNDYEFEIKIYGKYPQFKYWLAMNFFAPIPWEAEAFFSQTGFKEKNIVLDWYPVGTGPYMLTENNPNRRIILKKNPNYDPTLRPLVEHNTRGVESNFGQTVDEAHFILEKEAIPEWSKFLQGYYDASGVLSDSFDQVISINSRGDANLSSDIEARGINLVKAIKPSIAYMGFNMTDSIIGGYSQKQKFLRRAISIAINYEELLSIFANGRGLVAQGPIPPGIFGYLDGVVGINEYVYDWTEKGPKRKSIQIAKDLMIQAGYPEGIDKETGRRLTLFYDTVLGGPSGKAVLNWYRKQFKKLGIELIVRATDYNRFQEKIRKGTAQIFSWGWNADYPDPENFLFLLYGPNSKIETQGENATNYKNPEFDILFPRMMETPNGVDRQKIINRMVDLLREDSPWVWGYHPTTYTLYHKWMKGVVPNLMARNTLKYKNINSKERKQYRAEINQPVLWPLAITVAFILVVVLTCLFIIKKDKINSV